MEFPWQPDRNDQFLFASNYPSLNLKERGKERKEEYLAQESSTRRVATFLSLQRNEKARYKFEFSTRHCAEMEASLLSREVLDFGLAKNKLRLVVQRNYTCRVNIHKRTVGQLYRAPSLRYILHMHM